MRILLVFAAILSFFSVGYAEDKETSFEVKMEQYREQLKATIIEKCDNFKESEKYQEFQNIDFDSEEAKLFFDNLFKEYLEGMDSMSEAYLMYYAIKGVLSAPKFDDMMKEKYQTCLELREKLLSDVIELCDNYPEENLARDVKKNILESKTELIDIDDMLLLCIGKSSKVEGVEKEAIQEFIIENIIKQFMMCMSFDFDDVEECYENIFESCFYSVFLNICRESNNNYLNTMSEKYKNLDGYNLYEYRNLNIPFLDKFNKEYIFNNSSFICELFFLYDDYLDSINDLM